MRVPYENGYACTVNGYACTVCKLAERVVACVVKSSKVVKSVVPYVNWLSEWLRVRACTCRS